MLFFTIPLFIGLLPFLFLFLAAFRRQLKRIAALPDDSKDLNSAAGSVVIIWFVLCVLTGVEGWALWATWGVLWGN